MSLCLSSGPGTFSLCHAGPTFGLIQAGAAFCFPPEAQ
jgi:hypothetical protein